MIVTAAKEDSGAMGQDHLLVPASEREGESSADLPDMADRPDNGEEMEEANSPASGDHLDEAEGVGGEGRTAITADRGKDDVHGLSEVIEVMDDVEMKDEEEKGEERRDSDSVVPLNLDNLLDRSIK